MLPLTKIKPIVKALKNKSFEIIDTRRSSILQCKLKLTTLFDIQNQTAVAKLLQPQVDTNEIPIKKDETKEDIQKACYDWLIKQLQNTKHVLTGFTIKSINLQISTDLNQQGDKVNQVKSITTNAQKLIHKLVNHLKRRKDPMHFNQIDYYGNLNTSIIAMVDVKVTNQKHFESFLINHLDDLYLKQYIRSDTTTEEQANQLNAQLNTYFINHPLRFDQIGLKMNESELQNNVTFIDPKIQKLSQIDVK